MERCIAVHEHRDSLDRSSSGIDPGALRAHLPDQREKDQRHHSTRPLSFDHSSYPSYGRISVLRIIRSLNSTKEKKR